MDDNLAGPLAFGRVYEQNADAVYRFCLAQLRDAADAEDVAADVFASAYAAYARARPDPAGVRAWLFRIARNAVIDRVRRSKRRAGILGRLHARAESPDVEGLAGTRADLREVLVALGHLSERDRLLVGLRIAAGLTYAEVGAVSGLSENAARMATVRALDRVRSEVRGRE